MIHIPPDVTPDMLQPEFWLERAADPDAVLMDSGAVETFNTHVSEMLAIPRVLELPDMLPREEVAARMAAHIPTMTLYTADGRPEHKAFFENCLRDAYPKHDPVSVRFGLVIQRTEVRAFPTSCVYTRDPFDFAFDRLQETTIDLGWPVAIVAEDDSRGKWFFCLTPLYWGWVRAAHIATGSRNDIAANTTSEPFIVTIASRGLIGQTGCTPQMGTRLPLVEDINEKKEPPEFWRLRLPARRDHDGSLFPAEGIAPTRSGDFHLGYLPLTLRSLFTQAFKMLGESYAWGGSRMGIFGRDCSRFIKDVYATTGVILPRNGSQQGQVCRTAVTFTPDMNDNDRQAALVESVSPGAILVFPGHVMLYLGHMRGHPYIIHDTSSSGFSEVIVSDLSLGADSPSRALLRRLTHAVEITQKH